MRMLRVWPPVSSTGFRYFCNKSYANTLEIWCVMPIISTPCGRVLIASDLENRLKSVLNQ